MTLNSYITWFKAHEKLVFVLIGAFLVFHFYGSALDAWVHHDERLATIEQQKVTADHTTNESNQKEIDALKSNLASQAATIDALIKSRTAAVKVQQTKNDTMTNSELAARFIQVLSLKPEAVTTVPSSDHLDLTSEAAHVAVNALEELPGCKATLIDLSNETQAQSLLISKQETQIDGLGVELVDEKKSHVADVNLEKAKGKRSWLRGFKWGFVVGAVTVEAVRILVGRP